MQENPFAYGFHSIPEYNYENYILYENNREAVSDSREYISEDSSWPLFYLYGSVGLGKTCLAHAMANLFLENNPHASVRYTKIETLVSELIGALYEENRGKQGEIQRLSDRYGCETDFLILDDIQYLEGKSGTGEFISEILKQRLDSGRKTVIISDRTMECQVQKIPAFSESLRKCHCAEIKKPDEGERLDILRKLSEKDPVLKNHEFRTETLEIIASESNGDIRSLRGSLLKLAAYDLLMQG